MPASQKARSLPKSRWPRATSASEHPGPLRGHQPAPAAGAPAYFVRDAQGWQPTTWQEYAQQVRQAARALVALGVQPGDAVCILGFNRPEWTTMDLAAMMVGAMAAGIYWSSAANRIAYIVEHSGCSLLLVEGEAQWAKAAAGPGTGTPARHRAHAPGAGRCTAAGARGRGRAHGLGAVPGAGRHGARCRGAAPHGRHPQKTSAR